MADAANVADDAQPRTHILGMEGVPREEIETLLDLSESYIEQNRQPDKKSAILRGRTLINVFFENSTRTRTSFPSTGICCVLAPMTA